MAEKGHIDLRVLKTRRAIRHALISLMDETELSSITVAGLAQRAQISRKTFYLHYSNLRDVLDEMLNELIIELRKALPEELAEGEKVNFHPIIDGLSSIIDTDRELYVRLIQSTYAPKLIKALSGELRDQLFKATVNQTTLNGWQLAYVCRCSAASLGEAFEFWIRSGATQEDYDIMVDVTSRFLDQGFEIVYADAQVD